MDLVKILNKRLDEDDKITVELMCTSSDLI
jgi:hypothetical protein